MKQLIHGGLLLSLPSAWNVKLYVHWCSALSQSSFSSKPRLFSAGERVWIATKATICTSGNKKKEVFAARAMRHFNRMSRNPPPCPHLAFSLLLGAAIV